MYTSESLVSHLLTLNITRLPPRVSLGLQVDRDPLVCEEFICPPLLKYIFGLCFLNMFPQLTLIQSVSNLYLFTSDVVRINYSSYLCYISHDFMIKRLNNMNTNR